VIAMIPPRPIALARRDFLAARGKLVERLIARLERRLARVAACRQCDRCDACRRVLAGDDDADDEP
jgi:hypothetical protein